MSAGIANTPEELFDLAKCGKKLKPKERLAVVTWLEGAGRLEEIGEQQLAFILKCKSGSIRTYIKKAKQTFAAAITAEDAMGYMASYLRSTEAVIKECKTMLADKDMRGTGLHLGYMRLLKEVEAEKIEKLQSIGVIPKELGRLTAVKEEWKATVSSEGVTGISAVEDDNEPV